MSSSAPAVERAGRAHVRDLFLRLLGLIFLAAFLSLLVQITALVGDDGLLPARDFLARAGGLLDAPTIFRWVGTTDATLRGFALFGAAVSGVLACNVAPRCCLIVLWIVYLSFVTIGQDFFSFQWDNLLLETAVLAVLLAPGGLRPRAAPAPHPVAVALALWLLFRLHVESGLAKLLLGDPSWRDLTALASYYETAPLPTWVGWWAHQLPLPAHRATALLTYLVELVLPFGLLGPRRLRVAVFAGMLAMQLVILLTANYGFFNHLSSALCLFALDDGHLGWVAARFGRSLAPRPPRPASRAASIVLATAGAGLIALSLVAFLPLVPPLREVSHALAPVHRIAGRWRSVNAYHLFAQMTYVRREAVIEGSADGITWLPYELRWKPGDPQRAPAFVAPHQPRLDFQLWFLLLGGRGVPPYFLRLLEKLETRPDTVAAFFAHDPFGGRAPAHVRVAAYRYAFTDVATRRATGAWWTRTLEGHLTPRPR
jgi:hypothetical protein